MSVYDEWMSVYDEWRSVYDEWMSVYRFVALSMQIIMCDDIQHLY